MANIREQQKSSLSHQIIEAWNLLTKSIGKRGSYKYDELRDALGGNPNQFAYQFLKPILDYINGYCSARGMPPLSVLVVGKSGNPGSGFSKMFPNVEAAKTAVAACDWSKVPPPSFPV